ncbi:MAG: pilus assembly protein [Phenylobacterium sp.]|nr:pilus assembly protein [Phenylobacterium sp.]
MRAAGRLREFRRDCNGAAAVELALVLPMFAAMLFGVVQLGWGLYCRSDVNHAVEVASRAYVIEANTNVQAFRTAVAANLHTVPIEDVTLTVTEETMSSGARLAHIDWAYRHDMTVPFLETPTLDFGSKLTVPLAPPL